MMPFAKLASAALLAMSMATGASAGTSINSGPMPEGFLDGYGLGPSSWHTGGQTFVVPATENLLLNFSFTLGLPDSALPMLSTPLTVTAHIFAWNGTEPTTQIWASTAEPVDLVTIGGGTPKIVNFYPGVAVDPLATYIAILTVESADPLNEGYVGLGYVMDPTNSFAGDGVILIDGLGWLGGNGFDVVFSAEFATVPAPAALALFGAGLIGLGVARRRRPA